MISDESDEEYVTLRRRPRRNQELKPIESDVEESAIDLSTCNLDQLSLEDFLKVYKQRPRIAMSTAGAAHATGRIPSWHELEDSRGRYPYVRMLQRVIHRLRERDVEAGGIEETSVQIVAPQLQRDGPRKTVFVNFHDVCTSMTRTEENVMDFLTKELSTMGNLDSNQCLVLKGNYRDTHIEKALRKYAEEFVVCHACSSGQTSLSRDPTSRLYELKCKKCDAARNVSSASAGFAAQTARRAAQRAKQM